MGTKSLLSVFLGCVAVQGAILYTNISTVFPSSGFPNSYAAGSADDYLATTFVATSSGSLGSISTDVFNSATGVSLTAGLYTNFSGEPESLLESWSFTEPGSSSLTTLGSVLNPSITSGTTYWFVLNVNGNTNDTWGGNDTTVEGGVWAGSTLTGLSQFFSTDPTPGIELVSTPEPGTLGMLVGPLALLGARRAAELRQRLLACERLRNFRCPPELRRTLRRCFPCRL